MALGLVSIFGLTGMNVYSLYALHENTVQNTVEKQKRQMLEFTNQVRSRFSYPVGELWQLDMQKIGEAFSTPETVPTELINIVYEADQDPLFSDIYLYPTRTDTCTKREKRVVWKFDNTYGQFERTPDIHHRVNDGLAMAQTRMNSLIGEYQWNTRVFFDSHNSITIVMVDPDNQKIIGYLNFLINREYLVNEYLTPKLTKVFGSGEETGIILWLHDWTKNEVLATTDPNYHYNYQKVDFIQNFPDLLNDWNLKAAFTANPVIAASRASLMRNLFVLGGAVILIVGALAFIFYTAQRERSLVERQSLFLANVTHELQTPLSVILAAGENLSDGRVSDTKRLRSYGTHIYTESMRLRSMIERLLDTAKMNSNGTSLQKKQIDLPAFTKNLLTNKQSYFDSNGVNPVFECMEVNAVIHAVPDDITSALDNLIENAIKYSQERKFLAIRIFQSKKHVTLEVEDHGIGIPRKAQKYIFDKFFRVEDTLTATTKGHGLGLSIVKNLVKRNGGTIRVSSSPGKGSTFTLSFPVYSMAEDQKIPGNNQILKSQKFTHVS